MLVRPGWLPIVLALLGGFASVSLAWLQWSITQMQQELAIGDDVRERWEEVRVEIQRAEDLQDNIAAFFEATGDVTRVQFELFATSVAPVRFEAVSFAPCVSASRRRDFERELSGDAGQPVQIWEIGPDGRQVPAEPRSAHFPVAYIYPGSGNFAALGFDLASEPRRQQALMQAIRTGKIVRTDPIRLVQRPDEWAFLIFQAIYTQRPTMTADDCSDHALRGVVSSVYSYRALAEKSMTQHASTTWTVALFDASETKFPVFVRHSRDRSAHIDLDRPLDVVRTLPGAHVRKIVAMERELIAVFIKEEGASRWWTALDAAILATLVIGLVLTAGLVRSHLQIAELIGQLRESATVARARTEDAEQEAQAKSRLLTFTSHDLRQPLHALELFVAHLREQPLPYESAKIVANIDLAVQALSEMLDAVLDLSRLERGMIQPVVRPMPVAELWVRLRDEFEESAAAKNLHLRFRPSPLWLMTDAQLLHRIVLNLVSNAIRYTRTGGVLVACRRSGTHALLEVWDTGVGIAPELGAQIFEAFVQIDNPERNRMKGLGVGLSIVERAAALLGHRLHMRSVPGRGTCFKLEVPIVEAVVAPVTTAPSGIAASSPGSTDLAGCTVLVVEDDLLARNALCGLLGEWGCIVVAAADDEEARTALAAGLSPELVICDFRLPDGKGGIELIGWARTHLRREVAAFILSGDTSGDTVAAARDAGLLLLRKPIQAARLRLLVYRLLGRGPTLTN